MATTVLPEPGPPAKPKLLEQVRTILRTRHYSLRTEEAYLGWIRRFILFHGKRHPQEMGEQEIAVFLNHLANEGGVAAATQNQALNGLVFLYQVVLERKLGVLEGLQRVRRLPRSGFKSRFRAVAAVYDRRPYPGKCRDSAVTDRRYRAFATTSRQGRRAAPRCGVQPAWPRTEDIRTGTARSTRLGQRSARSLPLLATGTP